MKDTLWKLFRKTGEVKYFLLLKELESKRGKDDRKRGGNRS
ncbi:MAG: YqzL family protein [Bacillota bacterium]|nr:MAG: YqzL family protein [Bacillota bacterium]